MSVRKCLNAKVKSGALTKEQAKQVRDMLKDFEAENRSLGPVDAELEAAKMSAKEIRDARRAVLDLKRAQAWGRLRQSIEDDSSGPNHGAASIYDAGAAATRGNVEPSANVESRISEVLGDLHSRWANGLQALRSKALGLRRELAASRNVVRELFGEETGDVSAREVSATWKEMAEYARLRFNRAGGQIPFRQDWGLPHQHSAQKIGNVTREEWIDDIMPRLDRDRMMHFSKDRPLTDDELRKILDVMYDRIRTNGLVDVKPGSQGGKALANRRADPRVLTFKNADEWLAYNEKFGVSDDPFDIMVGHMRGMARDIGMMEVLGPNPTASLKFITDTLEQRPLLTEGSGRAKAIRQAKTAVARIRNMHGLVDGSLNTPENEFWANIFGGARSWLRAAQLGGAFLSALADPAFQRMAARYNGLSTTGVMRRQLALMDPKSEADRLLAVRSGFIAESWANTLISQSRQGVDLLSRGSGTMAENFRVFSDRLADITMRASLLEPWTQAGRHAFGLEFLATLADHSGSSLDEIASSNKPLADAIERFGLSAQEWDAARAAGVIEEGGARFMNARAIADSGADAEVGRKLMQGIMTEAEFAVPSSSLRARALLTQGERAGTFWGEVARSVALYKSFPTTVLMTHWRRAMTESGMRSVADYTANLAISTTLMGAFAYQMKQVQRGKTPAEMDPSTDKGRKFWAAAMLQGGGAGIIGDFAVAGLRGKNRFGHGIITTLAGPVAGAAEDVVRETLGTIGQGDLSKIDDSVAFLTERYTPFSSLWYSRLAAERLVFDQLNKLSNPSAFRARTRRRETRMRQESGQRYFWRRGEALPPILEEISP